MTLLAAVADAYRNGLCPIPAATDGTKRPDGEWLRYQHDRPDWETIVAWFTDGNYDGFGIVCGAVSGGLELLELEGRAMADGTWLAFKDAAKAAGLFGLLRRIANGYCAQSPSRGRHVFYRCPEPRTLKLATTEHHETLIETKGEGGFVIVPPSNGRTHPTGRSWVLEHGSFADIVTISADEAEALRDLARSLDRAPRRLYKSPEPATEGTRPGDDFNDRGDLRDVLDERGWTFLGTARDGNEHWRRPGKSFGNSANWHPGRRVLYVFSSSTPFPEAPAGYRPFAALAFLQFEGDFDAAAAWLRTEGFGDDDEEPEPAAVGLDLVKLSEVGEMDVDWTWESRLPRGMVTIVGGDPGEGKSYFTVALAVALTNGERLPGHGVEPATGEVLMANFEDVPEIVIRKRARLCGFGEGVHLINGVFDDEGHRQPFTAKDLPLVEDAIRGMGNVSLVVIDPVASYVGGKVNTSSDNEVRAALLPLVGLARRHRIAVAVVMHLRKQEAERVLYRLSGSAGGFGGVARSVLLVGKEPDSGRRAIAHIKCNVGALSEPVEFKIDDAGFHWVGVAPDLTAERLLGRPLRLDTYTPTKTELAMEAIGEILWPPGKEVWTKEVMDDLVSRGFRDRTVDEARKRMTDAGQLGVRRVSKPDKEGLIGWKMYLCPES